jgi:hypothetical protein
MAMNDDDQHQIVAACRVQQDEWRRRFAELDILQADLISQSRERIILSKALIAQTKMILKTWHS